MCTFSIWIPGTGVFANHVLAHNNSVGSMGLDHSGIRGPHSTANKYGSSNQLTTIAVSSRQQKALQPDSTCTATALETIIRGISCYNAESSCWTGPAPNITKTGIILHRLEQLAHYKTTAYGQLSLVSLSLFVEAHTSATSQHIPELVHCLGPRCQKLPFTTPSLTLHSSI